MAMLTTQSSAALRRALLAGACELQSARCSSRIASSTTLTAHGSTSIGQHSDRRAFSNTHALLKKRRGDVNEPPLDVVDEVPVIHTKGKGPKGAASSKRGARSKRGDKEQDMVEDDRRYDTTTTNQELEGENFDQKGLQEQMERMVGRCRETVSKMVGSHGRADPALLDNARVTVPAGDATIREQSRTASGQSYSLKEFATVGVRDGALVVTCFDPDTVKHVERAIYELNNGLAPQQLPGSEPGVLRVPIPRPTTESRKALMTDVNRICENARISLRASRHVAQKQIRKDESKGVVSNDEAFKEMQQMEADTKKRSAEVDTIEQDMRKKLES